jgi:hypothetical protein
MHFLEWLDFPSPHHLLTTFTRRLVSIFTWSARITSLSLCHADSPLLCCCESTCTVSHGKGCDPRTAELYSELFRDVRVSCQFELQQEHNSNKGGQLPNPTANSRRFKGIAPSIQKWIGSVVDGASGWLAPCASQLSIVYTLSLQTTTLRIKQCEMLRQEIRGPNGDRLESEALLCCAGVTRSHF